MRDDASADTRTAVRAALGLAPTPESTTGKRPRPTAAPSARVEATSRDTFEEVRTRANPSDETIDAAFPTAGDV